ncbi:MAG: OmpH family outer membrane protein [Bacteroidales bacterium]|nr:OmpH family outer membrane protein [Bacteroidales bacterium]
MKKTSFILSIAALVVAVAAVVLALVATPKSANKQSEDGQEAVAEIPEGAIVYFDFDRVLEEYDLANELRASLQTKMQNIEQELKKKQNRLERDQKTFQDKMNKGILTSSTANEQYNKLQQQMAAFQDEYNRKQQEMAEEQQAMMNQLTDAVQMFVDSYNEDKQFDMVIAFQKQLNMNYPIVSANKALDITDQIIEGLNAEYIKSKEQ